MLLGCCHCGEQQSSSLPPPSESVPSIPSSQIGRCHGCYTVPDAWSVDVPAIGTDCACAWTGGTVVLSGPYNQHPHEPLYTTGCFWYSSTEATILSALGSTGSETENWACSDSNDPLKPMFVFWTWPQYEPGYEGDPLHVDYVTLRLEMWTKVIPHLGSGIYELVAIWVYVLNDAGIYQQCNGGYSLANTYLATWPTADDGVEPYTDCDVSALTADVYIQPY